ncbi:phage tail tip lysozyme [Pseudohoeflea coraliihabitans]|uniref:Phage tail lysozyme domain-containing protein n=1 Tax=Pseudohoeflea coraliihabitans TaxID=2860393 RepID=A0ABS6WUW3_9HYPH|nr:phage tail tip lysozyme [Pseudohoeflea sp. DP4N28-3]MBW3099237.1 hypothetical protein [Pseudohoeflea sp. DP4N28-3]
MARYDRDIADRLMDDLQRDFGLSPAQAAGIVGNLAHESAGFKSLQEKGYQRYGKNARGGYGYAQWTGPRRTAFENWARANKLDPRSYAANYGFLSYELTQTPEKRALDKVKAAQTPEQAAQIFSDTFLRPGEPHMGRRTALASDVFNAFGAAPVATPTPFSGKAPVTDVQRGLLSPISSTTAAPSLNQPNRTGLLSPEFSAAPRSTASPDYGAYASPRGSELAQSAPTNTYSAPGTPGSYYSSPRGSEIAISAPVEAPAMAPAAVSAPETPDSYYSSPRGSQVAADALARENLALDVLDNQIAKQAAPVAAPVTTPAPPLAAPVTIAPAPKVTPYTPPATAPAPAISMPAVPAATGMDVWSGKAMTGTATNGNQMSRNPDGTVSMTSEKYGYTETMNPDGSYRSTTAPGLFGIDAAVNSALGGIKGPTGGVGGINVSMSPETTSRVGGAVKGAAGAAAGSMVGGMLGPIGALLGAEIGRQIAKGNNPLKGILGGTVSVPGGFPAAPSGGSRGNGELTEFGAEASRGVHGAQAQYAANNPGAGLW